MAASVLMLKVLVSQREHCFLISVSHRAFFNSVIDKHENMHFFTFKTVLV